jgi:hypothetical protein
MPCIKLENQNHSKNESQIVFSKIKKLFLGINSELYKRDFYYSTSDPARYAFFAFFVAAILVFIIMTCLINRRRMKDGRAPVISSYLSPPTYNQSQNVYGVDSTNLPTYTPNANANQDVGYYDKNGNFIPAQTVIINQNENQNDQNDQNNNNNNNNNISDTLNNDIELNNNNNNNNNNLNSINNQHPSFQQSIPSAVYTSTPNVYEPQNLNDMSYKRPNGPPPTQLYNSSNLATGSSNNNNNNTNDNASLPPYEAPPLPEKSYYKN